MKWMPTKLNVTEWKLWQLPLATSGTEPWYDIACRLNDMSTGKLNKYRFTCAHSFRIQAGDRMVFCFTAHLRYDIHPEGSALKADFLDMLVNRAHLLFSGEFDKRKKGTILADYTIHDFDAPATRSYLEELIQQFYATGK
jgi:hypothetical protein